MLSAEHYRSTVRESEAAAHKRIKEVIRNASVAFYGVLKSGFFVYFAQENVHGLMLMESDRKYLPFIRKLATEKGFKIKVSKRCIRFMT